MANKANDDSRCRRRLILYGSDNICGGGGCANDNAAVVGDADDCDREFRIVRRGEFDLDDRDGWNAAAAMDGGRSVNARIVIAATTHHHHDVRVLERRRRGHFDSAAAASAIGVDVVVNMTTPRRRLPHSRSLLLFEDEHNIGVFAMSPSTP